MVAESKCVRYVGSTFVARHEGEPLYLMTVVDEEGDPLKFYITSELFSQLQQRKFGDEISLILRLKPYQNRVTTRVVDFVG